VSFGPRNSSIGRCENVSLILERRFPVDAGSFEVISYRKTFFSFPNNPGNVIFVVSLEVGSLKVVLWTKNYKMQGS
jgi:hypothetical protein